MSACFDIERGGYTTESCLALLVSYTLNYLIAFRQLQRINEYSPPRFTIEFYAAFP